MCDVSSPRGSGAGASVIDEVADSDLSGSGEALVKRNGPMTKKDKVSNMNFMNFTS